MLPDGVSNPGPLTYESGKSLRRKPSRKHHGQGKERLETNPSQPPTRQSEDLCGARARQVVDSMDYDTRDVVSIDMKACYPASFQGMGETKPYFERFGQPTHHMTRVAINGAVPRDVGTGFAEVQEWEYEATCHPVIPAWFGRHFADVGWAPTLLLVFLVESGLLKTLKVREAIVSFG